MRDPTVAPTETKILAIVSIPGNTCRVFGKREEQCWMTHTPTLLDLL